MNSKKSRSRVLAGNWKMNMSPGEAIAYFADLSHHLGPQGASDPDVLRVIFPVAYCLGQHVQEAAAQAHIQLGAQNVHWEEKGAFTGELSCVGLKHVGIQWVLIGHSERRQYFGETNETAQRRLSTALSQGMNVIFCIGETLAQREAGKTEEVLAEQLVGFLQCLKTAMPHQPMQTISLAYEPVWAIGTGKTATTSQAQEAHAFIRKEISKVLGEQVASTLPLLYGGSVTPENARELLNLPDVDGVLVGGASLKPEGFAKILKST